MQMNIFCTLGPNASVFHKEVLHQNAIVCVSGTVLIDVRRSLEPETNHVGVDLMDNDTIEIIGAK